MSCLTHRSLIHGGKRVLRIIGWREPGKPGSGSFSFFRSPLSSASFSGHFDVVQTRRTTRSVSTIHRSEHPFFQLFSSDLAEIYEVLSSRAIRIHNLAAQGLDLSDNSGLKQCSTVGNRGHRLGHLQWRHQNVSL